MVYVYQASFRQYATKRKVAGSIPDGFVVFFIDIILPSRTVALGSTQPLTEMSTGNISWRVKADSA